MANSLPNSWNSGEAFTHYVHEHHHKQLMLFAGGLAKKFQFPSEVAEELIQDFYVQMGTKWETFTKGYHEKGFAYLAKAMKNLYIDQRRKYGGLKIREQTFGESYAKKNKVHFSIDMMQKELLDMIQENLSKKEFETLHYYIRGYQYNEIAEELGIPEGTVGSRMFRARAKVADLFGLKFAKKQKHHN